MISDLLCNDHFFCFPFLDSSLVSKSLCDSACAKVVCDGFAVS